MSLEDLRAEISADRQFRGSKQMARTRWRENEILPFHVVKDSRFVRFHVFFPSFCEIFFVQVDVNEDCTSYISKCEGFRVRFNIMQTQLLTDCLWKLVGESIWRDKPE